MCKCLNPTIAYICGTCYCKADGVLSPRLVFSEREALHYFIRICGSALVAAKLMEENEIAVPCGKCAVCQIRKRKDMSVRLSNEASMHDVSCFITLTYDDQHVPTTDWRALDDSEKMFDVGLGSLPELTLIPSDVQKFVKRLRRHLEYLPKRKHDGRDHVDHPIRYFAVGEYGGKTHRPHYHILIFGWSPSDKFLHGIRKGREIYRSKQLEKLWTKGYSTIQDVGGGCAKYCARYVTKKFARLTDGSWSEKCVVPEFILQSTRYGGIGAPWFDRFGANACQKGFVTVKNGDRVSKCAVPRYYFNRLRKKNLPLWLSLRDQRMDFALSNRSPVNFSDLLNLASCEADRQRKQTQDEVF